MRYLLTLAGICWCLRSEASPVNPQMFCYRTAQALENHLRLGYTANRQHQAVILTRAMIDDWLHSDITEYLPVPHRPDKFLPVNLLIQSGMELQRRPVILHSTNELRFLPYTQVNTDLVLMTGSADVLTPRRARVLVATAIRRNVRIHVIWLPNNSDINDQSQHAAGLAHISQLTSGRFLDLASKPKPVWISTMTRPARLDALRDQIRSLDDKILDLMSERLELAKQVGKVKFEEKLPIKNFQVEKDVIERAKTRARSIGLYENLAEQVAKLQIRYAVMTQEEDHSRQITTSAEARKIVVVGGCGGMGRWLIEFFESFGHKVSICDLESRRKEVKNLTFYSDISEAAAQNEFVILATPISVTEKLIDQLSSLSSDASDAIILDICSLKSPILNSIQKAELAGLKMTSIHPMFGPRTELLSGQNIVFCDASNRQYTDEVMELFRDTTANLVRISLKRHDELMGYVLGMSHMVNLAFAKAINDSKFSYRELEAVASSTFRAQMDVSIPIVNENQDLYYEIQHGNQHTVVLTEEVLASFRTYLEAVEKGDRTSFKEYMENSRRFFE